MNCKQTNESDDLVSVKKINEVLQKNGREEARVFVIISEKRMNHWASRCTRSGCHDLFLVVRDFMFAHKLFHLQ